MPVSMRVWVLDETLQIDLVERVKRIELSSVAWEATALPLSYTRKAA